MKKFVFIIAYTFFSLFSTSLGDGLLLPSNQDYPKDLLRNNVTEVTVNINGSVAETIVYQEFENEWTDSTDAVYSFPLPADARATKFLYWYNDKIYQAVLKVKEQAVNPGTGEGGIAGEVNNYIGRNGIKILLKGIKAGAIQKVELHYISRCNYYKGKYSYKYPLNTGQFITYPLNHLQFNINVNSNSSITSFELPNNPDFKIIQSDSSTLNLEISKPKSYVNQDFEFSYQTDNSSMGIDFYSVANDTMDGHFALFVKPQNDAQPDSIFPRKIIFLLSNDWSMAGNKLNQSIFAISKSLDQLTSKDYFNISIFNFENKRWQTNPVAASAENIQSAKDYLAGINTSYGSDMSISILDALSQINSNSFNNAILIFTNGMSVLNPSQIENKNTFKAGIFPIAIGDNIDRSRLEMTAALNYGFVTYLDPLDNLGDKMLNVFNQISQPILKDVAFEFGAAGVNQVIPSKIPSTFAGSLFFMTGRYKVSGESVISIAGTSVNGMKAYDFHLNFSADKNKYKFAEILWAKETIDEIERQIEVFGETNELKQKDIELSLGYNIRCRYTAYIADYSTEVLYVDKINSKGVITPESFIVGNYPNPFNPTTNIIIYINKNSVSSVKLLKIYNILGQLIAVIDITDMTEGRHSIVFNGKDMFGNNLPSGIYLVQLQVGDKISHSLKINLVK